MKRNRAGLQGERAAQDVHYCIICAEEMPLVNFPAHTPTTHCTHDIDVCIVCMSKWIAENLKARGWNEIRCPICLQSLERNDVQRGASPKTYAHYETLSTRSALSSTPSFTWCLNPSCNSGQEHHGGLNNPAFRCRSCSQVYCLADKCLWHTGEDCAQYQRRTQVQQQQHAAEERASWWTMTLTTRLCPNPQCGRRFEKAGGCDHMVCSRCGVGFCWDCGVEWKMVKRKGMSAHKLYCRYRREELLAPY
ncbi:hypothetical protein AOQ84DRAFT_403818 [Glonium stellatum]|uniref:RBR-type E3 ubiquitin transferase n=1 Tax=Glonium stellatum TaxID=574774 RepID=A0A8E2JU46_9PEZI|nr:hypothetical protein AOQ84DRAFT_403818 [Glonium stellatum]